MPHDPRVSVNLDSLVRLFYPRPSDLGSLVETPSTDMPEVYQRLLAHAEHMTVTVESHHRDKVDVIVLDRSVTKTHYARKILLCRQKDHVVVQYGIMRINYAYLADDVRKAVEAEETPLGRILIEHNVLRSVHLAALWRVTPGKELAHFFGIETAQNGPVTYGRTAIIFCDDEPAVELLEIVAPEG